MDDGHAKLGLILRQHIPLFLIGDIDQYLAFGNRVTEIDVHLIDTALDFSERRSLSPDPHLASPQQLLMPSSCC
jgi:hypothetical protein